MPRYSLSSRVLGTATALLVLAWSVVSIAGAVGVFDLVLRDAAGGLDVVQWLYVGAGVVGGLTFVPAVVALYRPNALHVAAIAAVVTLFLVVAGDALGASEYDYPFLSLYSEWYPDALQGGQGWQGWAQSLQFYGVGVVVAAWLLWFVLHFVTRPKRQVEPTGQTQQWYVHIDDQNWGPYTVAHLQTMVDEDRVGPLTPAHSPATDWTTVAEALRQR